jgi:hypothetical protein
MAKCEKDPDPDPDPDALYFGSLDRDPYETNTDPNIARGPKVMFCFDTINAKWFPKTEETKFYDSLPFKGTVVKSYQKEI